MVGIGDIYQYRQAAPDLATSGQPREEQLSLIAASGYEVVLNLALHDDPRYSLADEAASVRRLGLQYVHIPVPFDSPTQEHLTSSLRRWTRERAGEFGFIAPPICE
jgi:protein tyrosine phosphatase (PTP) superfamily phosphohydrolase (DUF442 family)